MFRQPVIVHYVDGTEKRVDLTQWSIGQFGQYAAAKGWKVDPENPGLLAVTMLRYQAYAEIHRDPQGAKATYERWDVTVDEVEAEAADEVVPTEPGPSEG